MRRHHGAPQGPALPVGPTVLEKLEIDVEGRDKHVLPKTQQFLEGRSIALLVFLGDELIIKGSATLLG